jgi:hypothetical protein
MLPVKVLTFEMGFFLEKIVEIHEFVFAEGGKYGKAFQHNHLLLFLH